jgi:hypothetical protein
MNENMTPGYQNFLEMTAKTDALYKIGNKPVPDVIYHYCGGDAAHKILRSSKLRMLHINFMNDHQEGLFLIKHLKQSCPSLSVKAFDDPIIKSDIYAACFSDHGDLLSQWRAYAGGGAGVALGFRTDGLSNKLHRKYYGMGCLTNIVYDDNILQQFLCMIEDYSKDPDIALCLPRIMWDNSSRFKDPLFEEEREWRYILVDPNAIQRYEEPSFNPEAFGRRDAPSKVFYEMTSRRVMQYIVLPFDKNSIYGKQLLKEVVIGPGSDIKEVYLERYLANLGYNNVIIRRSRVPFRL